jgi:hypothetical protein
VQPQQVFSISRYFLRYWLPLLTPAAAWLIVALRQRSYLAQGGPFTVSQELLAGEIGASQRFVRDFFTRSEIHRFIQWHPQIKFLPELGREVYAQTEYTAFQDEPLTPLHAAGLLTTLLAGEVDKTLRELAAWPAAEIIERLVRAAVAPAVAPAGTTTVAGVVTHLTGRRPRGELAALCSDLQRKIIASVGSPHLSQQYFRQAWVPLLGHALAWLVVIARSRCFDDGHGLVRDTFRIEKSALAGALGQSWRNVQNLLAQEHAAAFIRVTGQSHHRITLSVRMWQTAGEVLTPTSFVRWREMLDAGESEIIAAGKPPQLEKIAGYELEKTAAGKPPQLEKIAEHELEIIAEHLNTKTPAGLNTPTTSAGGGGDDFLTDTYRLTAIRALGINAAAEFKGNPGLTPLRLAAWQRYMRSTNAGPGAVVALWRSEVFDPPGLASARPALPRFTLDPKTPRPGQFSEPVAARLRAALPGNGLARRQQPTDLH